MGSRAKPGSLRLCRQLLSWRVGPPPLPHPAAETALGESCFKSHHDLNRHGGAPLSWERAQEPLFLHPGGPLGLQERVPGVASVQSSAAPCLQRVDRRDRALCGSLCPLGQGWPTYRPRGPGLHSTDRAVAMASPRPGTGGRVWGQLHGGPGRGMHRWTAAMRQSGPQLGRELQPALTSDLSLRQGRSLPCVLRTRHW